ncbi:MAG: hypothetical protein HQ471_03395 [Flavobacteriales bacterium]|jgi:hypothetical protein|nr:hypothetical protein [Flavobacteriales bacterium]
MLKKIKYLGFLFFLLISQLADAQCAMCKAVVESGDSDMAEGINNGILYLMAMPYLLVLVAALFFYRRFLKNKI